MNYQLYKLHFHNGVHFGKNSLDHGECAFHADTLFSALCHEAMKKDGDTGIEKLVNLAKRDKIKFSDALPFIKEEYYIPKPLIQLEKRDKKLNKLKYIPINCLEEFLNKNIQKEKLDGLKNLGQYEVRTLASIRGLEQSEPYRIESFYFNIDCGLYIIVGSENRQDLNYIEELLIGLSYSGIGGKRSLGMGRFELEVGKLPQQLEQGLQLKTSRYLLLSVALPKDDELSSVLNGKEGYQLLKRSGFIFSNSCDDRRKKDLYVFSAGSYFSKPFAGDVYDVSSSKTHPVYRYAKPMFMGVLQ